MASVSLSIAVGAGAGAVNGWTATSGGRVDCTIVMQLVVMDSVALGFIRRMLIVGFGMLVVEFWSTFRASGVCLRCYSGSPVFAECDLSCFDYALSEWVV